MRCNKTKWYYKVWVISLLVTIICFILLCLINFYWETNSIVKSQVISFLCAIETSAIAIAIWEFTTKKSFASEILELADISSNINSVGISHVYMDFQDIDWKEFINNTTNLKIAVTYANTWRESNRTALSAFVNNGYSLTIFLPDFNREKVIEELALRFDSEPEKVKDRIEESYKAFKALGAVVCFYDGSFQSTYYLGDNYAILSVFNHKRQKSTVPAIKVQKKGELYRYIKDEINAIEKGLGQEVESEE